MIRFFFLFFFLSLGAAAREVSLSLEEAPAYALKHNPTLAAARLRIEEARGRLTQAGRLSNPEVEVEFSRSTQMAEGSGTLAFMQRFPITARLRLEKAVTRAELAAAQAEVRDAERKLAAEVRTAAVKLLALRGQQALREKQLANSRELADFASKRVETGEASLVDATLMDLEAHQFATELLQLDVERAAMTGDLRPLLGLPASSLPVITGSLAPPTGLPAPGARPAGRADYVAAQNTAEAARLNVALARANRWEDLSVGLNVMRERTEDAPEGFRMDTLLGFKLSLPLPLWNKNEGRIQEAAATAARARAEVAALSLSIDAETGAARDIMAAWTRVIATLEGELLPKAMQIEEQVRTAYSAGQTPLQEVLRARDRRLAIERQRLDALRDFYLAQTRHNAATGRR